MINVISAADITFIMSSSTSAWLLSPLECSPQKQNGWTLRFCFWGWIMWKMYNKTIIEFSFHMISWIIKTLCLCYLPRPSASADNTDLGFDNSWYHVQPHPIIVYYPIHLEDSITVKRINKMWWLGILKIHVKEELNHFAFWLYCKTFSEQGFSLVHHVNSVPNTVANDTLFTMQTSQIIPQIKTSQKLH